MLRTLCRGITICTLLGCPFVPQLLRLSHILIAERIFLSLTSASCVLLNEKMGFSNFLTGVFSIALFIVFIQTL